MPSHKPKNKRYKKQRQLEGFKDKLEQGVLHGQRLAVVPSGKKMSLVLVEFVEPYIEAIDSEESYYNLLTLAVLAWNTALLPEDEQQEMVKTVLDEWLTGTPGDFKEGVEGLLGGLIARKKAHFAENRRAIIEFDLQDTGHGLRILVASTPEVAAPE